MCSPAHPNWRLCMCSRQAPTERLCGDPSLSYTAVSPAVIRWQTRATGSAFQWRLKRIQGTNLSGRSPSFGRCAPVLWRGVSSVHDIWPSSFSFSISQPISLSYALLSSVTHSWSEQSPQTRGERLLGCAGDREPGACPRSGGLWRHPGTWLWTSSRG